MKVGTEPIRAGDGDGRPRQDYLSFYTKILGKLKERKYPFFKALCPFHNDRKNPNLDVNIISGRCKCYACGKVASPWDFIVMKKPDGEYSFNFPDTVTDPAEIRKILQHESQEETEISELTLRVEERRAEQAHEYLWRQPLALRELHRDRGLVDDTIIRWKIGFMKGTFTFPIYDAVGDISSLKFHKKFQTEGAVNQLYPWSAVLHNSCPYVILVEGEFDMIITQQMGFNAVTQTAGANSWNDRFTRYFRGKTVYIAYDKDEAGIKNAAIIADKMWAERINALIVTWPDYMTVKEDHVDFFVKYKKTADDYRALIKTARSVVR